MKFSYKKEYECKEKSKGSINTYIHKLQNLSKQDLLEIDDKINNWKWDERLGNKPQNWDYIPNYMICKGYILPTKYTIIKPIHAYIDNKLGHKVLLKYHHLHNLNSTSWKFELWWIKRCIIKFFHLGIYSKKQNQMMFKILNDIIDKQHQEWINKTYYKKEN